MSVYSYTLAPNDAPPLGLIVLQTDETIERDMRRMLGDAPLYVTRVPSAPVVTSETLQQMANENRGPHHCCHKRLNSVRLAMVARLEPFRSGPIISLNW